MGFVRDRKWLAQQLWQMNRVVPHANFWEKLCFTPGLRDNNSVTGTLLVSSLPLVTWFHLPSAHSSRMAVTWQGCIVVGRFGRRPESHPVQLCVCHRTSHVTLSRLLLFFSLWVLLFCEVMCQWLTFHWVTCSHSRVGGRRVWSRGSSTWSGTEVFHSREAYPQLQWLLPSFLLWLE